MVTIAEMSKTLRTCYECTKVQSCSGCPYNGIKLDIIEYLKLPKGENMEDYKVRMINEYR